LTLSLFRYLLDPVSLHVDYFVLSLVLCHDDLTSACSASQHGDGTPLLIALAQILRMGPARLGDYRKKGVLTKQQKKQLRKKRSAKRKKATPVDVRDLSRELRELSPAPKLKLGVVAAALKARMDRFS